MTKLVVWTSTSTRRATAWCLQLSFGATVYSEFSAEHFGEWVD